MKLCYCPKCKQDKIPAEFPGRKVSGFGKYVWCHECVRRNRKRLQRVRNLSKAFDVATDYELNIGNIPRRAVLFRIARRRLIPPSIIEEILAHGQDQVTYITWAAIQRAKFQTVKNESSR